MAIITTMNKVKALLCTNLHKARLHVAASATALWQLAFVDERLTFCGATKAIRRSVVLLRLCGPRAVAGVLIAEGDCCGDCCSTSGTASSAAEEVEERLLPTMEARLGLLRCCEALRESGSVKPAGSEHSSESLRTLSSCGGGCGGRRTGGLSDRCARVC
mmetsp:Transcript_23703/g.67789  ORF Transcript_23703/g.67789 Transcript_23703/m.67789 type:complete len:160 (+) Transcript_23703:102-581(+)